MHNSIIILCMGDRVMIPRLGWQDHVITPGQSGVPLQEREGPLGTIEASETSTDIGPGATS